MDAHAVHSGGPGARVVPYLVTGVHIDGHVRARAFQEVEDPARLLPDGGRGDRDDNDDRTSTEAEAALLKARPHISDLHAPGQPANQMGVT